MANATTKCNRGTAFAPRPIMPAVGVARPVRKRFAGWAVFLVSKMAVVIPKSYRGTHLPCNPPITSAVKRLLDREQSPFAARFHRGLEIQIQPFDDATLKRAGFPLLWPDRDENRYAYPIRIPRDAKTAPVDNDWPMPFPSGAIKLIGWTGWNWRALRSEFVAFDLDSIVNHEKAGLTADQLEAAQQAACSLGYVKVRRSKSGKGIHLYVEFADPPHTANHTAHARLAGKVLTQMSADAGFDFESHVDVVGGNFWFFERKAPA